MERISVSFDGWQKKELETIAELAGITIADLVRLRVALMDIQMTQALIADYKPSINAETFP